MFRKKERLGRNRFNLAPPRLCLCPKCGYAIAHERGIPCNTLKCPICNVQLKCLQSNKDSSQEMDLKEEKKPIKNKFAIVDPSLCIGCGNCVDICSKGAIEMKDSVAFINVDLCRGCRICVSICPVGAIS